ncbi:MAG: hypothetical protein Q4E69_05775 [Bacilli bacterium]|nr:hypothetical protein [Bacilli bacterium]
MIEKIKNFFNKYYHFFLILIPTIIISKNYQRLDNDAWFILNTGRYLLKHGFFYIDPFTIHEGLKMIVQQWLTDVIYWSVFHYLGNIGFFIFITALTYLMLYVHYKLVYLVSEKKLLSTIFTVLCGSLWIYYMTSRPQMFTYLILLTELLVLEKYIKTKNNKLLIFLPILSFLQINLHASVWFIQFLIIGTFIVNGLVPVKYRKEDFKVLPIIIVTIIMFIVGFINPYFYKAVFYLYYSYGSVVINNNITEMHLSTFGTIQVKQILILVVSFIFLSNFIKKFKVELRHYFIFSGLLIFAFMHNKSTIYFLLVSLYALAYGLKDVQIKIKLKRLRKYINKKNIEKALTFLIIISSIGSLVATPVVLYKNIKKIDYHNDYEGAMDYLLEHYDSKKVILYADYNNGGYPEFRGVKSYIDPRAEVFLKKFNGKEDILEEFFNRKSTTVPYIFYKYKFTHLLVSKGDKDILMYLYQHPEQYELVYTQYKKYPNGANLKIGYLYARKDNS